MPKSIDLDDLYRLADAYAYATGQGGVWTVNPAARQARECLFMALLANNPTFEPAKAPDTWFRKVLNSPFRGETPAVEPPAYYPEITDRELVIRALRAAWSACRDACSALRAGEIEAPSTLVGTPCTDQGTTPKRLREEIKRAREGKVPCPGPGEKEPNR